jgi:hypothetical protein
VVGVVVAVQHQLNQFQAIQGILVIQVIQGVAEIPDPVLIQAILVIAETLELLVALASLVLKGLMVR